MKSYWLLHYRITGDSALHTDKVHQDNERPVECSVVQRLYARAHPDREVTDISHITDCERQKSLPADECGPQGAEGVPGE